jgi:hypothetical protein
MSTLLTGYIRNGRVELNEPINLPDGTVVVVARAFTNDDEGPMTQDEIAHVLARMKQLQPLEIPDTVHADLDAWEQQLNQRGIARSGEDLL